MRSGHARLMRALGLVLGPILAACVSDNPPPLNVDGGKLTGDEGGPCFNDGTCKSGLVCLSSVCVRTPDAQAADVVDAVADAGCQRDLVVSGAISYWSGSVVDRISTNNFVWKSPSFVKGKIADAFNFFAGQGDHPTVAMPTGLSGLSGFTVEFWFSSNLANVAQRVIALEDAVSKNPLWTIDLTAANDLVWSLGTQGNTTVSIQSFPPATVTHVAFTMDGSKLSAYRNGVAVGGGLAPPNVPFSANAQLRLGNGVIATNAPLTGTIEELALYGRALSANELGQIATASKGACRVK